MGKGRWGTELSLDAVRPLATQAHGVGGGGTEVIKIIYLKGGYIIGIFLRLLGKLIMPFIVTRIFQIQF